MLGPETRTLRQSDFGPDNHSYLPELKANSIDQDAFVLSYHCHTPINYVYKMPPRKRRLMMEFLTEQRNLEKREIEKASRKK